MTAAIATTPTANKRHRCEVCGWSVMPGEQYSRVAVLDEGAAWTLKICLWCDRILDRYFRETWNDTWDRESVWEYLEDVHPTVWKLMRSGWRYPDGERLPLPLQFRCVECAELLIGYGLWCGPCDRQRVERLTSQFSSLQKAFLDT